MCAICALYAHVRANLVDGAWDPFSGKVCKHFFLLAFSHINGPRFAKNRLQKYAFFLKLLKFYDGPR